MRTDSIPLNIDEGIGSDFLGWRFLTGRLDATDGMMFKSSGQIVLLGVIGLGSRFLPDLNCLIHELMLDRRSFFNINLWSHLHKRILLLSNHWQIWQLSLLPSTVFIVARCQCVWFHFYLSVEFTQIIIVCSFSI